MIKGQVRHPITRWTAPLGRLGLMRVGLHCRIRSRHEASALCDGAAGYVNVPDGLKDELGGNPKISSAVRQYYCMNKHEACKSKLIIEHRVVLVGETILVVSRVAQLEYL